MHALVIFLNNILSSRLMQGTNLQLCMSILRDLWTRNAGITFFYNQKAFPLFFFSWYNNFLHLCSMGIEV